MELEPEYYQELKDAEEMLKNDPRIAEGMLLSFILSDEFPKLESSGFYWDKCMFACVEAHYRFDGDPQSKVRLHNKQTLIKKYFNQAKNTIKDKTGFVNPVKLREYYEKHEITPDHVKVIHEICRVKENKKMVEHILMDVFKIHEKKGYFNGQDQVQILDYNKGEG